MLIGGAQNLVDGIAIIGQENQSLRILVQAANGENAFGMVYKVDDVVLYLSLRRAGNPRRLVQRNEDQRRFLHGIQQKAIDHDAVAWENQVPNSRLAVIDFDLTSSYISIGLTAAAIATFTNEFIEPLWLHGAKVGGRKTFEPLPSGSMKKGAILSPCQTYRYALTREWDASLPSLLFVLYNPSTADAEQDDPTLRKCMHLAKQHGYGGLTVVNRFGLRATRPEVLRDHPDPEGPDNLQHLIHALSSHPSVVCAWGLQGGPIPEAWFHVGAKLYHLGLNLDGSPKHPLYRRNDQALIPAH